PPRLPPPTLTIGPPVHRGAHPALRPCWQRHHAPLPVCIRRDPRAQESTHPDRAEVSGHRPIGKALVPCRCPRLGVLREVVLPELRQKSQDLHVVLARIENDPPPLVKIPRPSLPGEFFNVTR